MALLFKIHLLGAKSQHCELARWRESFQNGSGRQVHSGWHFRIPGDILKCHPELGDLFSAPEQVLGFRSISDFFSGEVLARHNKFRNFFQKVHAEFPSQRGLIWCHPEFGNVTRNVTRNSSGSQQKWDPSSPNKLKNVFMRSKLDNNQVRQSFNRVFPLSPVRFLAKVNVTRNAQKRHPECFDKSENSKSPSVDFFFWKDTVLIIDNQPVRSTLAAPRCWATPNCMSGNTYPGRPPPPPPTQQNTFLLGEKICDREKRHENYVRSGFELLHCSIALIFRWKYFSLGVILPQFCSFLVRISIEIEQWILFAVPASIAFAVAV